MLVFSRDVAKGERICSAISPAYEPRLVICEKDEIQEQISSILEAGETLLAVMAVGIAVRLVCPYLRSKWTDAAVVAVDSSLHCAVPVVGGHHGANDLARALASGLGLFPAITTATDSLGRFNVESAAAALGADIINRSATKEVNVAFLKEDVPVLRLTGPKVVLVDDDVAVLKSAGGVVVGLGARRGISADEVIEAIAGALHDAGREIEDVRVIATAWLKKDDPGIGEAAKRLGKSVIYLPKDVLNAQTPPSPSRARDLGLSGVAESAVIAISKRLIMRKKVFGRVTVALGE